MPRSDEIEILTIPHTGTTFLRDLLRSHIGEVHTSHWPHTYPGRSLDKKIILSTIRDPYRTYVSVYSRNEFGPMFFERWALLNEAYEAGALSHVLPIDHPDRGGYLNSLSRLLGLELVTDWAPVNSAKRHEPPKIDLSQVYSLSVVRSFGYRHEELRAD